MGKRRAQMVVRQIGREAAKVSCDYMISEPVVRRFMKRSGQSREIVMWRWNFLRSMLHYGFGEAEDEDDEETFALVLEMLYGLLCSDDDLEGVGKQMRARLRERIGRPN